MHTEKETVINHNEEFITQQQLKYSSDDSNDEDIIDEPSKISSKSSDMIQEYENDDYEYDFLNSSKSSIGTLRDTRTGYYSIGEIESVKYIFHYF